MNGAGRETGRVPKQSGQSERIIARNRDVSLIWIIATQHFDQLCDNFHSIWQLSAGWNGKMQCFRSFLRPCKPHWVILGLSDPTECIHSNHAKAYLAPAWSQSLSGSRCPSPPETYVHGSSGMSHLWHKLWSCPECCPGPPGGPCPPCQWGELKKGSFQKNFLCGHLMCCENSLMRAI